MGMQDEKQNQKLWIQYFQQQEPSITFIFLNKIQWDAQNRADKKYDNIQKKTRTTRE